MTRTSFRTRYGLLTALPLVVCALVFLLPRQQRATSVATAPALTPSGAPATTTNPVNAPAPSAPTTPSSTQLAANDHQLKFLARTRREVPGHIGRFDVIDTPTAWDARQTAVILCDLWDRHWCDGATQRVGEMALRVNELVKAVRARGGLIIHGPSDTMKHYAGTAARQLAQDAPPAPGSMPFKWNYLDPAHEGPLPLDDKDGGSYGGSDDVPQGPPFHAWTCEHPAVQIIDGDAVSESGQEVFNLFQHARVVHGVGQVAHDDALLPRLRHLAHAKAPAQHAHIEVHAHVQHILDAALLRGIGSVPFESDGSLYRSAPLNETADPLLVGCSQEKPVEPVAWTNTYKGGRVFYTSLGHPDDFHTPQFRRLLLNGVRWALDQPVPLD